MNRRAECNAPVHILHRFLDREVRLLRMAHSTPPRTSSSKSLSPRPVSSSYDLERQPSHSTPLERFEVEEERVIVNAWHRFRGDYRKTPMPTIWQSMIGLHSGSSINALFIFLPISWTIDLAMKDEGGHKFSASTRFARAQLYDIYFCTLY